MQIEIPTEEESSDELTEDCACTPLLACWRHYYDGDRGRPAVKRHAEST